MQSLSATDEGSLTPEPERRGSSRRLASGPVGKTVGGDTSRQTADANSYYREFWSVNLKAGDYVTVDWSQPAGGGHYLRMLAPGTNDNNFIQQRAIADESSDSTGHDEFTRTIQRSGTFFFELRAYGDSAGAYQLAIHIRRGIRRGDAPSAAPLMDLRRWYRGDTSRHVPDADGTYREFWKVRLRSGQHVTVSFVEPSGGGNSVYVLPPGTNNSNFSSATEIVSGGADSTGHGTISFVAPRNGVYVIDVKAYGSSSGAYRLKVSARR